jgi:WD40 repeat protein
LPPSQCSRAIAFNPVNGHIAVGHNDGTLSIRESKDNLNNNVFSNTNSNEWIEAMRYSPCGSKLAVGSHDNAVYVYNVTDNYKLIGKCTGGSSYVTSVDWSLDGKYIRIVNGSYELLFYTAEDCK